jgi:F0F1-type ATP synthase epsilon subunit
MSQQHDPDKLLKIQVLSLGKGGLELEQVERLQVCLEDGSWLGIRPGHAPMIAATGDGELKYRKDDQDQTVLVKAGILTLSDNLVSILTTH